MRPLNLTPTLLALTIPLWIVGCAGQVTPAALDVKNDQCGTCRMVVSSQKTAAEVAAPYQDPKFFDDLGCLNEFLAAAPLPKGARVFVADHRTGEWVAAERAVFSRIDGRAGAMGSPFVAHASAASRDADHDIAGSPVVLSVALPAFHVSGGQP